MELESPRFLEDRSLVSAERESHSEKGDQERGDAPEDVLLHIAAERVSVQVVEGFVKLKAREVERVQSKKEEGA